jgi:phospholipase/carboxylesterase
VPDVNSTHLLTYNGWTMRVRHATQEPARLMLLLHGWTGDENSMWIFARNFPADLWIAAPRGPYAFEEGGYSWRPPHSVQENNWGLPTLSELKPAADSLIRLVDEVSASINVDTIQFNVAGFSQGGALANVLALLYPTRIRRAAVLSGFMPEGTEELITRHVLAGKPIFVAHGKQDNLVPVERAQRAIGLLEQAGALVTFCEAEVGHKVSADCLRGLEAFFRG